MIGSLVPADDGEPRARVANLISGQLHEPEWKCGRGEITPDISPFIDHFREGAVVLVTVVVASVSLPCSRFRFKIYV